MKYTTSLTKRVGKICFSLWIIFPLFFVPLIYGYASPSTYTINIQDFAFSPSELHIERDDTVVFKWVEGSNGHNVAQVSDSKSTSHESGFRSGSPQDGPNEWTLPREYIQDNTTLYYICEPHVISHSMWGKIIIGTVSDSDSNGANLGIILGIFIGTGLFFFAGIVFLNKRGK